VLKDFLLSVLTPGFVCGAGDWGAVGTERYSHLQPLAIYSCSLISAEIAAALSRYFSNIKHLSVATGFIRAAAALEVEPSASNASDVASVALSASRGSGSFQRVRQDPSTTAGQSRLGRGAPAGQSLERPPSASVVVVSSNHFHKFAASTGGQGFPCC